MLPVLALVLALQSVSAMFFHAPSSVILQGSGAETNTDFGFSMVYMNNTKTLVVGAPKADKIGKVFNCEMNDAEDVDRIACGEQYMEIDSSWYNTEQFPEQRFHLGATIVAHNDYFFTCAPLWTTKIEATNKTGKFILWDTFGTCFVQNDTVTNRYQGLLESYQKHRVKLHVDKFNGGTGWSTLIDKNNDVLLMTKTGTSIKCGDIFYLPASKPLTRIKYLTENPNNALYLSRYWNIGFGLTAGKFFTGETMYAASVLPKNMEGLILFLTYRRGTLSLLALTRADANRNHFIAVSNNAVGAMFGTTMSAVDLNMDRLDELLVGAPAQSEDECVECGALHIYIGGDMKTINERKRIRSIFGNAELGRFGTAIAAKDIDGDGKSELVVSAPYENHGSGAIYILSGYEVYNTLMKTQDYKSIQLSELKLKQRIHKESYRALGFSLQFVTDVDDNACDELAASSPGNSTVLLFKCVQKINVTLSSHLIGEQTVREQDKFFTVAVCARVELPPRLPVDIVGNITIENSINIGEAAIVLQPYIVIDISCFICDRDRKNLCGNVTVEMTDKEPADYTFKSKAVLQNYYLSDPNMAEFNSSWVETSPYSTLEARLDVYRHCKGDDCNPDLSMNITWSGRERYVLGSSANETVKIKVTNIGNASYSSCVWVKVTGAPLTRVDCEAYQEGYRCYMPKPLRRDTDYNIDLQLNMTKPTNEHDDLLVEAYLYENCNQESNNESKILKIPFDLYSEGVFNDGDFHRLNITDKQILEKAIVYDHHEYPIRNNGTITWKRVNFTVSMQKTLTHHYISSFTVTAADFGVCNTDDLADSIFFIYNCVLDLPPNTTQTIIGTTEIHAGRLNGLVNGDELNMTSSTELYLSKRFPMLQKLSNTRITIQKDINLGNRKWLIALIAGIIALILLAILTIILYKCGFFRRKQKQVLLVAKESVRRKSIRRDTHASAKDGPVEGLQMDVDDDCPFEEARPVTTKDNVGLVVDDEP